MRKVISMAQTTKKAMVFVRSKEKRVLVDGCWAVCVFQQYCAGWVRDNGTWFATEIPDEILEEAGLDDEVPF